MWGYGSRSTDLDRTRYTNSYLTYIQAHLYLSMNPSSSGPGVGMAKG